MQKAMIAVAGIVMVAVAAAALFFLLAPREDAPVSPAAVNVSGAEIGGPFALIRHDGMPVTDADVITGPTLVYFGYTFCPDICPIDVQIMADAVDLLAERGIDVTPVFVTVDPARDTPEALAPFVEAMHPKMVGLTGEAAAIKAAADAYKVYFARVDVEGSAAEYLMNHTGFTYFMLPDGIAALFRRGFPAEEMAGEIERVLKARGLAG
ncbi:SCO family protein [Limibaculum sp. FT325]|uniref:SCO family protein n=1 Tax=Thermohalobaculum sediminis TaxID=2939436 RepID=UPI0020BE01E5|nr:SCO family protein [Limibaculum sediminis]MCL5776484.1 SCO family protein [Limibaculum sediminis]